MLYLTACLYSFLFTTSHHKSEDRCIVLIRYARVRYICISNNLLPVFWFSTICCISETVEHKINTQ